jgi:hypothetical protein
MSNLFLQNFLLSILIAIPAIIGVGRYRLMDASYHPFVWICIMLTLNETLRFIFIMSGVYNFVSYNIASLLNCLLYIWLFHKWGAFNEKRYWLPLLFAIMPLCWLADHFIIDGYQLPSVTHYFRACFSLMLVLLSVNQINRLILSEKKSLLKNSQFLICMCLVAYYTNRIVVDVFTLKGMSESFLFRLGSFNRSLGIGLNLIFALAALWIPRKKNFTIQL